MESIFKNDSRYDALETELFSWLGTPYKHFTMVKRRGADCVLFPAASYHAIGCLTHLDSYEYYSRDWYRHTDDEFVQTSMSEQLDKYALPGHAGIWVPKEEGLPMYRGDLLGFSMSKSGVTHHASVLLDGGKTMIHSINGRGVQVTAYTRWWERHRTGLFRIYRKDSN